MQHFSPSEFRCGCGQCGFGFESMQSSTLELLDACREFAGVPFDQLTEADVLSWVYTQIDKDAIETDVQARLEAKLNPTVVAGVPW